MPTSVRRFNPRADATVALCAGNAGSQLLATERGLEEARTRLLLGLFPEGIQAEDEIRTRVELLLRVGLEAASDPSEAGCIQSRCHHFTKF